MGTMIQALKTVIPIKRTGVSKKRGGSACCLMKRLGKDAGCLPS